MAPEVLLDQPARRRVVLDPLVEIERGLGDACHEQAGQRGLALVTRASQIRTSTVPNEWCGRTLHQICVCSTIEPRPLQEVHEVRVGLPAAGHRDPARGSSW